ncbi:putative low affinity copper uptake protein 2 [Dirofilaria immitis]|nr:putative low affinity copper uptake protein 2 [Dirofilaria immitis]
MIKLISSIEEADNWRNDSSWVMNSMVLHFTKREFILFDFWKTGTVLGMSASVLIVFLLSVLYEAVKEYLSALRLYFARNRAVERQNRRIQSNIVVRESSEHVDSVSTEMNSYSPLFGFSGCETAVHFYRIVQSSLYFTQVLLTFTLMLTAMTFNVWIILGIVFGEAAGYFLFSEEPISDENIETCC